MNIVKRFTEGEDPGTRAAINSFYIAALGVALFGQSTGAVAVLDIPIGVAIPSVIALELGGVALAKFANSRRVKGEIAFIARAASAAIAGFAIWFNWYSHSNVAQAVFFAVMSLVGYVVYLLRSGAKRRDARRAVGHLAHTAPDYGVWQWFRHPQITLRARSLAQADPALGRYGSLAAVVEQDRAARRTKALAELLYRKIAASKSPLEAEIAAATYDFDELAARIRAKADYDKLSEILAADLVPSKVAGVKAGAHTCKSKASGGRTTPGCPGCDAVIDRRAARAATAPRRRTRKGDKAAGDALDQTKEIINTAAKRPENAPTSGAPVAA